MMKGICTSELDYILGKDELTKEDIVFLLKLHKKDDLHELFRKPKE